MNLYLFLSTSGLSKCIDYTIFVVSIFLKFVCVTEGIVGPLISSSLLPLATNDTLISSYEDYAQLCGANDCLETSSSNPNLEKPNSTVVRSLLMFAETTLREKEYCNL